MYLDEMQAFLYDDFDVRISIPSLWETLAKLNWSRKAASKAAAERNELLRRAFRARCQQIYTTDQVVCLDESAANERTGDRKYGWSPVNSPVDAVYSARRSERWSVLPAMDPSGYITHVVYQGAITAELIEHFVATQVLPLCNSWPGKRSVILLDNASIHKSVRLQQMCRDAGVILEYLPPYSPDFNPIEQTFKALKSWIKRNFERANVYANFAYFLEEAVQAVCYDMPAASKFYTYCGWVAA